MVCSLRAPRRKHHLDFLSVDRENETERSSQNHPENQQSFHLNPFMPSFD